ncbi:MAG: polysaccharide biosynthesis C-terminal domain-containing protein, partial [Butyrivibrio sp.]|nr:polysaccharide biosynthesis C-terminal domain-containing protein [Butyrivibrio sp.]
IELHLKKTQYISMGTITAGVINIILNVIFIPKFGFIAAAYTTLASYFVNMFMHFFVTRFVLKVKLYDDWFMFAAIGVVSAISAVFMSLYSTIIIRYALLVVICLIYVVLNWKTILGALERMKSNKSK